MFSILFLTSYTNLILNELKFPYSLKKKHINKKPQQNFNVPLKQLNYKTQK